jgi:hypothetical protein
MNESVKVLFAYQGQNESELTISENEILTVVEGTGDWWLVKNNQGHQGYVPSNYVEKITGVKSSSGFSGDNNLYSGASMGAPAMQSNPVTQNLAMSSQTSQSNQVNSTASDFVRCTANHDYKASRDDELNLRKGQIVDILEKSADGWWMGRSEGKDGWFPSNFVEVQNVNISAGDSANVGAYTGLEGAFAATNIAPQVPAQNNAVKPLHTVKALYEFVGQEGELSFVPDQVLEIIEKPEGSPDWWRARDLTSGMNGLIPANYVEVVSDSSVPNLQFEPNSSVLAPQSNLEDQPYYKGQIGRQKAEDSLRTASTGQFLVRKAESCPRNDQYSISVRASNRTRHFRIAYENQTYKIGAKQFSSFAQLVEHYSRLPIYVSDDRTEQLKLSSHA